MNSEMTVQPETDLAIVPQFHFLATNKAEIANASTGIKAFLVQKLEAIDAEIALLTETLETAVKHKWKSSTYRSLIARAKQQKLYYGKIHEAVDAGFQIVPNMDCNIFAVRTKRKWPKWNGNEGESKYSFRAASPSIPDEEEQRLQVGEGEYQSVDQKFAERHWKSKEGDKEVYHVQQNCNGFQAIEFPLAIAHPVVMNVVAAAMAKKIFDRVGIVPTSHRRLKGDPIVLGQITRKEGYSTKTASFLIAWYLDPRTL